MYYALFFLGTSKYEFKLGPVDSPFCSYCNKGDDDNDLQEDFLNLLTQCEALLKQSVKSLEQLRLVPLIMITSRKHQVQ